MKTLFATFVTFSLLGCANGSHEHASPPQTEEGQKTSSNQPGVDADADDTSNASQTVEVACGSCIYEMPGVSGCKLAAKIDGNAVLVSGGGLNAHESGLCSGAKQATVKGEMQGGQFVATEVKLK